MCPFMGIKCDGGGNRPQSNIDLVDHPHLAEYFSDSQLRVIPSGVCSLQLNDEQAPWIVCPRRLLFLGKSGANDLTNRNNQLFAEKMLLKHTGFESGIEIGVWSEVKMKFAGTKELEGKSFDYTFDYILIPMTRTSQNKIEQKLQLSWNKVRPILETAGYTLSVIDGQYYVENFPSGYPVVVEIMTSSTSGGNKRNRTTIPMAFEDAILEGSHTGPGINYRQVWARMVSQLIVKSEVGLEWGGKTIWILQDNLVDYISKSTALDVRQFLAERTSEVNILSLSYGEKYRNPDGIIRLQSADLFAGPIQPSNARNEASFQDMIRIAVKPPLSTLLRYLSAKLPSNIVESTL
jgi:hypothetical protein